MTLEIGTNTSPDIGSTLGGTGFDAPKPSMPSVVGKTQKAGSSTSQARPITGRV